MEPEVLPDTIEGFEADLRAGKESAIVVLSVCCMRFGHILLPRGFAPTSIEECAHLMYSASLAYRAGVSADELQRVMLELVRKREH